MLKEKIMDLMERSDFMTLSTSVAGNSSAANVYFSNDGLDIYFFTFNPSRKAVQIAFNPKVQCVIRPDGEDGIKELQIDGFAKKITDSEEKDKAREAILKVTKAFTEYMHDDFLIANDVVGYYKIEPTVIKYVDFFAETQFEWIEIPENKPSVISELLGNVGRTIKYWMTVVRGPFLTATIAPILLGSAIAYKQFGTFDWSIFWLVLLGAIFAQCGTNTINDYFDHKSRNDELNKLASPFLGIMYTGFLKLAYNGLGDLAVFIGFGPLMVYGAAYMQNQSVDPVTTLLFSVPVGIFVALILFINCFQDYNADKAVNKNSWVVRLAGPENKANYRAPFKVWKNLMMLSFTIILGASLYTGNLFTLIALLPLLIFNFASKKGSSWLDRWEKDDANLQQLPYELLIVNVSTIGIHFLTGMLLTLGFLLSTWI